MTGSAARTNAEDRPAIAAAVEAHAFPEAKGRRGPFVRSKRRLTLGGCLLCGTASLAAVGAARAQAPGELFSESIDVELLDLQAVVTDRDGRRVRGLAASDFVVRIDGEVVPIELFDEVGGDPGPAAPGASEAVAPPPLRPPVNYLVFIDDLMTLERNRDLVLERLIDDLDLMEPSDRMAVVRLGRERRLRVLADWTSDRETLIAALRHAQTLDAWGIRYIALRRMTNFIANWEGNDTRRAVLAAAGSLRMLDPPDGRRAMLLVAGSWDPDEAYRAELFAPWCVTGRCQGTGVYDVLTDTANQLGYAIYAVDVEGTDPDFNWAREKRLHHVLKELARVTGGRRLLNGDRQRMLAAAVEDTRSYYAIAVTPPPGSSDRRLRVEIEALPPGLSVRSQSVAVAVSPERERELDVVNALWRPPGNDPGVGLVLDRRARLPRGRMRVEAKLSIDGVDATAAQGDAADLTLRLAAVDSKSDSEPVRIRHLRLSVPPRARLVLPWEIELRRRPHTVVIEVQDHGGGTIRTAVATIDPRSPAGAAPAAGY